MAGPWSSGFSTGFGPLPPAPPTIPNEGFNTIVRLRSGGFRR